MYRALLVDDEIFAVKAMVSGVNWAGLGICEVYEAFHAQDAREKLEQAPIDLVICDIEMPEENGLELASWIKSQFPDTMTIFLTCHADFAFAQKAIQLGSFDYLLKPVIYKELAEVVGRALNALEERQETKRNSDQLQKFLEQKKPALIERFWQDILSQRLLPNSATFQAASVDYQLPLGAEYPLQMILISVEKWMRPFNARDEEIMLFALRNAAEEIIVGSQCGHVVEDSRGNIVILLYGDGVNGQPEAESVMQTRCATYMEACNRHFYCQLSCYIGLSGQMGQIMKGYHGLLAWEQRNVVQRNSVLLLSQLRDHDRRDETVLSLMDWTDWFENGEVEVLHRLTDETLDHIAEQQGTHDMLLAVYHSFLQVVYYVLHRKGIDAQQIYKDPAFSGIEDVTNSIDDLKNWMKMMNVTVINILSAKRTTSSIVLKLQSYIKENLHVDFSREDLAEYVFLNPAYVSRLFRKETGVSLSDYILQERMDTAADLLQNTDQTVSQIAVQLGYGNFSHFARMFKRVYHVAPNEYRKK
ncbi:helix-turn-helix domain-containing protein [Gorillibacterium massiliense]|uniref:helix-turn-helix domain-containing protein n=1 Tax=Gorillibacterium massiliense TaxID=1280390 RepID=UPI000592DB69|nr:helix-turn-helix domain-containing protein [Gorillibacterium massiliense]